MSQCLSLKSDDILETGYLLEQEFKIPKEKMILFFIMPVNEEGYDDTIAVLNKSFENGYHVIFVKENGEETDKIIDQESLKFSTKEGALLHFEQTRNYISLSLNYDVEPIKIDMGEDGFFIKAFTGKSRFVAIIFRRNNIVSMISLDMEGDIDEVMEETKKYAQILDKKIINCL
ncbi:MAG: hypothetical protein KAQ92_03780 [Candidatus Aenigmarchaeota archaeon]|nr:hypothetical protein [Candidatus Aenigmarchaeota archaeon]